MKHSKAPPGAYRATEKSLLSKTTPSAPIAGDEDEDGRAASAIDLLDSG